MEEEIRKKTLQQRMDMLRRQYAASLPKRVDRLEQAWRHILQAEEHPPFDSLIQDVHNLTGSGSIYGFPEISRLAAELELLLAELQRLPPAPPSPGERAKVEELLHSLRLAIGEPA